MYSFDARQKRESIQITFTGPCWQEESSLPRNPSISGGAAPPLRASPRDQRYVRCHPKLRDPAGGAYIVFHECAHEQGEVNCSRAQAAALLRPESSALPDGEHPAGRDRARIFDPERFKRHFTKTLNDPRAELDFQCLVKEPGDWPWSSWRFYHLGDASVLAMDRMP